MVERGDLRQEHPGVWRGVVSGDGGIKRGNENLRELRAGSSFCIGIEDVGGGVGRDGVERK